MVGQLVMAALNMIFEVADPALMRMVVVENRHSLVAVLSVAAASAVVGDMGAVIAEEATDDKVVGLEAGE